MTLRRPGPSLELAIVVLGFAVLTVALLAPLALQPGSVARLDNADTRFLIWNVAWVARTLVLDPLHVFDANIFHPHRGTLAYSEANLGAGALAIPVYWTTGNAYLAHNMVVLASFVLSGTATYYLVRHLTADRRAAAIAGICFAYCPYVISHLPHVHLLMTAGLPLSLLAFHRTADRPHVRRGAVLGAAIGVQAIFCGYYGVFAALTVGLAVIAAAAIERRWGDRRYWTALAVGAGVALAIAVPLFVPYLRLQRATGFVRPIEEAVLWSAGWRSYLASPASAHAWLLPLIGRWTEVLFPGFVAAAAGSAGLWIAGRRGGRWRRQGLLYATIAAAAAWASLGPGAGLYAALHAVVPGFGLMHAPSRFGVLVTLALAVGAGFAFAALFARIGTAATATATIVAAIAALELRTPLSFTPVPPVSLAYRMLATLPDGPVLELPFYSRQFAAARTHYVLNSTVHWKPLVNGYSSHTPAAFVANTPVLAAFPSPEAFELLERDRVRYVVFHLDQLGPEARAGVSARLEAFEPYLARHYADDRTHLYEIVAYPVRR